MVRQHLLDTCASHAAREGDDLLDLDSTPLDEMAAEIASEARLRAGLVAAGGNETLSTILVDLAGRLESADCQRCATTRGFTVPCGKRHAGVRVDSDLVHRRGECIVDLRDAFDFAIRLGADLYSAACPEHEPAKLVDVELCTRPLARTTNASENVRLAARTDFDVAGGRHRSLVTLSVDGSRYGAAEREAASYYLVHEIVAHAFYDAYLVGIRSHLDPHDVWAEGWMDCIAIDLLIGALEGRAAGCPPPPRLCANQSTIDVVRHCHAERYDPGAGATSHVLNGMRLARKRYQAMRYRLNALAPRSDFDPMRIIHLACAIINANGATVATVAAVNSASGAFLFGARQGPGLTAEERRFYAAMASFVGHRDEERLAGELA